MFSSSCLCRKKRRERGFTLIELLVVIAIIAILAAILFPVFARARENARRSSCQSNLKQLALGVKAYVQDYDEKFPLTTGNGIAGDAGQGWAGSSQSYLKSVQILQCPSEVNSPVNTTNSVGFSDYWYNGLLNSGSSGVSEASLNYVSNTFLNGDGNSSDASYSQSTPDNASTPTWANRHLDGANYSFADGHVKWLRPTVPVNTTATSSVFTFST